MLKKLPILFALLLLYFPLCAQLFPKENSKLNYILIGFSFPATAGKSEYRLEIAEGNHNSEGTFKKHIIRSLVTKDNKMIADVPSFGKSYTWRVITNTATPGDMHHFSTQMIDDVNPDSMLMTIEKKAEKYQDAYYFSDINRALYDMNGKPIWFIPQTDTLHFEVRQVRDLKITNRGTITFIIGGRDAYEINYNGDILWKAPKTHFQGFLKEDTSERYNHEITRLSNGHYMVLGSEFVWSDTGVTPPKFGEIPPLPKPGQPVGHPILFGTITEYDGTGKTVWSWKSAPYFQHHDIGSDRARMLAIMDDVHQNSFFFDEQNKMVYLSYKNLNRIIKIKYPEGTIVASYGQLYKPDPPSAEEKLFCYQHCVKLARNGDMYLFNNNSCHSNHAPEILMFKEPSDSKGELTTTWQYEFPVQPLNELVKHMRLAPNQPPGSIKGDETVGGNAEELPDHSMFASLCSPYGDLFIISRDKKVLWHAVNEKWNIQENNWRHITTYRASLVKSRHELEEVILNSIPK